MLTETHPFREKGWKLPLFSWEMPKDYLKASEQFLMGIGKPLGNA
jgi:hypothetical protein